MAKNPQIGESFESFLRDEGIYDDVTATAIKRTLALQIKQEMAAQNISKSEMARRMKTSATQLGGCSTRTTTASSSIRWSGPRRLSASIYPSA